MNTVTFSAFKTNMEKTIQSIFETHQPVVVKKNRGSSVVVMPLEDYQALTETKYLLNSPANAARLVRGIEEIEDLIARPYCNEKVHDISPLSGQKRFVKQPQIKG